MAKVIPGRFTAVADDEEFVVFFIGMRINKLWAVHKWLPVFLAMGRMISELYRHPELGFKSTEGFWGGRTIGLLQYWRSYEQLETFARGGYHLETWKKFNQMIGSDGSVGIFHETYIMKPGTYEAVYNNMPVFGLAKAFNHQPAKGRYETARRRLGGDNEPAVPSPPDTLHSEKM
ncbi:DUF4188 domain-containing protein [Brevibacillus daliensis]|uniref:DUF4188 domain-containing protein n=1 Tax=Brevibacillus daliensis TaxID=2892995 RepID=UPI001E601B00|nr:DUF4188 domain-containing protein [Brevibacillus daliensis]